jgi:hypothetical protein
MRKMMKMSPLSGAQPMGNDVDDLNVDDGVVVDGNTAHTEEAFGHGTAVSGGDGCLFGRWFQKKWTKMKKTTTLGSSRKPYSFVVVAVVESYVD